jgi:hypothetical protein
VSWIEQMMMLLRSDAGCVFKSISTDRGKTWTVAEPIDGTADV